MMQISLRNKKIKYCATKERWRAYTSCNDVTYYGRCKFMSTATRHDEFCILFEEILKSEFLRERSAGVGRLCEYNILRLSECLEGAREDRE